jgi:hypothetical protein
MSFVTSSTQLIIDNHYCPVKIKSKPTIWLAFLFGIFGLQQQKLPWAKVHFFPDSRYSLS